jgi:hypothetical protein
MSSDTLNIYREHLDEQLGVNAPATEEAVIDPSGTLEANLYGVFDDNTFRSGADRNNNFPKSAGARFTISKIPDNMKDENFDIYTNVSIYFPYRDKTYLIQYIEKDEQGAQVLWMV